MIANAKNKASKPKRKSKRDVQKEKILRDRYGIYPKAGTGSSLSASDVHGEKED